MFVLQSRNRFNKTAGIGRDAEGWREEDFTNRREPTLKMRRLATKSAEAIGTWKPGSSNGE